MAWSFLTYSLAVILLISLPISVHHQKLWSDDDEHPKASSTSKIVNQTDNKFTHKPEIGIHQPRSNDVFVDIPKPGLGTFVGFSIPINYSPGQNQSFSRKPTLINAFLGIPYAAPPVGDLRFQRTQPAFLDRRYPWLARKFRSACLQQIGETLLHRFPSFRDLSEDCLYLNIFYPNSTVQNASSSLLPVLVHLHGGSYAVGSSHTYPGLALASTDLVVVTLNYRLDVLGFLSTGTSDLPGNYGLWDQLMALKWIKNNIAFFGGDPNRVTLMGESAGAASVGLHIVSPVSRKSDLFQQAIMISGSELSPWAVADPALPVNSFLTHKLSRGLNCNITNGKLTWKVQRRPYGASPSCGHDDSLTNEFAHYQPQWSRHDIDALIQCLRYEKSGKQITGLSNRMFRQNSLPGIEITWTPLVDGPDGFLPVYPTEAYLKRQIRSLPLLAGVVRDEDAMRFDINFDFAEPTNKQSAKISIECTITSFNLPDFDQLSREVFTRYKFNEDTKNASDQWQRTMEKIDRMLVIDSHALWEDVHKITFLCTASKLGEDVPIITLKGLRKDVFEININQAFMNLTITEQLYPDLIVADTGQLSASDEMDAQISHLLLTTWSNFVKYGNPTPGPINGTLWTPYNASDEAYLWIGTTSSMKRKFRSDNMAFWHQRLVQAARSRMDSRDDNFWMLVLIILACLSIAIISVIAIILLTRRCKSTSRNYRPGTRSG